MPIYIIEPSLPWWSSLINPTNWLPLLVVIIGAFATYFYANRLEDKKNRYDLKVRVYFEALDVVHSLNYLRDQRDMLTKTTPQSEPEKKICVREDERNIWKIR